MTTLSLKELRILLFLVRNRLHNESRRPARMREGRDIQALKVWELKELKDKLEEAIDGEKTKEGSVAPNKRIG